MNKYIKLSPKEIEQIRKGETMKEKRKQKTKYSLPQLTLKHESLDKTVVDLCNTIDELKKRIRHLEEIGAFQASARPLGAVLLMEQDKQDHVNESVKIMANADAFRQQIIAEEREACAKLVEEKWLGMNDYISLGDGEKTISTCSITDSIRKIIAWAIRNRT
jgi:hypothetical protein